MPVAGQVRCVLFSSGAVGRPIFPRRCCSSQVRYPEIIHTGDLVCMR